MKLYTQVYSSFTFPFSGFSTRVCQFRSIHNTANKSTVFFQTFFSWEVAYREGKRLNVGKEPALQFLRASFFHDFLLLLLCSAAQFE